MAYPFQKYRIEWTVEANNSLDFHKRKWGQKRASSGTGIYSSDGLIRFGIEITLLFKNQATSIISHVVLCHIILVPLRERQYVSSKKQIAYFILFLLM